MHETTLVLELRCSVGAPGELVFRAFTEPALLARWWGPSGFTNPEVELDLTVGGAYRIGMQPPDGVLFHLAGEFLRIEPPTRLAYTFRWEEPDPDDQETVVRLVLDTVGETTEVTLAQGEFRTEDRLELHRNGWTGSFEKLRALVESGDVAR